MHELDDIVTLERVCKTCGKIGVFKIPRIRYIAWLNIAWLKGAYVQDVVPELSADAREFLISSVCGECFDKTFPNGYWGDE